MTIQTEHPFAQYIRALGKGKKGSRSLTQEEAHHAFTMILDGTAEPIQTGAFLMLLRVKEETPEELAGFVQAVRHHIAPITDIPVALDWSSYAGKRKHLPWFILSALLLAENDIRIFMHGSDGHTAGRLYTEQCFQQLGLPTAQTWSDVETSLNQRNLCFFHLKYWCPTLQNLIDLRNIFGLRSPVHTLVRLINPLAAPCSLQSIFHPAYAENHQHAAHLLGQQNALVIKGDGGEFECRPEADSRLYLLQNHTMQQEQWPRYFSEPQPAEPVLDIETIRRVWRGEEQHHYAEQAIIGTAALALRALQRAQDHTSAYTLAMQWWQQRNFHAI